jgi:hypothetical protein
VTGRDGVAHWRAGGSRKGHLLKLSPGLPSKRQDLRSRVLRLTLACGAVLARFPCPCSCAGRSRSCAGPFRYRSSAIDIKVTYVCNYRLGNYTKSGLPRLVACSLWAAAEPRRSERDEE